MNAAGPAPELRKSQLIPPAYSRSYLSDAIRSCAQEYLAGGVPFHQTLRQSFFVENKALWSVVDFQALWGKHQSKTKKLSVDEEVWRMARVYSPSHCWLRRRVDESLKLWGRREAWIRFHQVKRAGHFVLIIQWGQTAQLIISETQREPGWSVSDLVIDKRGRSPWVLAVSLEGRWWFFAES